MLQELFLGHLDSILMRFAAALTTVDLRETKPAELVRVLEGTLKLLADVAAEPIPGGQGPADAGERAEPVLLRESLEQWNARHQSQPRGNAR